MVVDRWCDGYRVLLVVMVGKGHVSVVDVGGTVVYGKR